MNMENNTNARLVALGIIEKIEGAGQYSNIALDTALKRTELTSPDKALVTALVYGTVENKIRFDHIIDGMASIPPSKIESRTRNILRMALYQLTELEKIPPHAAINEAVNLCTKRSKGFVNALLRNFLRAEMKYELPKDRTERLSVLHSVPQELCRAIAESYGDGRADAILSGLCRARGLNLRVNTLKISREELLRKLSDAGISARLSDLSPFGIELDGSESLQRIPGFDSGLWYVQDTASQLTSYILDPMVGDTVIDCCACPGGKSFSAAISMENCGELFAFDLHENKLSLIEKSAARLGIDIIKTAALDGRDGDESLFGCADRVICDVPCSGYGVIAKKPEIRYKKLSEQARLPEIQLSIAETAVKYLKKGGIMVYSTCTLLPRENEAVVKELLRRHDELVPLDFSVGDISSEDGMLTFLPDKLECDGFFAARFQKR